MHPLNKNKSADAAAKRNSLAPLKGTNSSDTNSKNGKEMKHVSDYFESACSIQQKHLASSIDPNTATTTTTTKSTKPPSASSASRTTTTFASSNKTMIHENKENHMMVVTTDKPATIAAAPLVKIDQSSNQ